MGILGSPGHALAFTALMVWFAGGAPPVHPQATLETDVKAAFLYNFTKFVDWPRTSSLSEPLRLCVVNDDALRRSLEKTIEGETVNGRPLESLVPRTADDARRCQLLFLGGHDGEEGRMLSAVRDHPVLTVSDTADFAQRGGGIEFVLENNRLRFDVNLQGAERGGIKVSSRLLRVARRVHESPKKK